MSLLDFAKKELDRAKWAKDDSEVMLDILKRFLNQWDSGGAVWAVAPVLQRLLAFKCLTPLTNAEDEWMDVSEYGLGNRWKDAKILQSRRISSVFKEVRENGEEFAYDLDHPQGRDFAITFPYLPTEARVADPTMVIESSMQMPIDKTFEAYRVRHGKL